MLHKQLAMRLCVSRYQGKLLCAYALSDTNDSTELHVWYYQVSLAEWLQVLGWDGSGVEGAEVSTYALPTLCPVLTYFFYHARYLLYRQPAY